MLWSLIRRSAGQSSHVLIGCALVVCGFELVLVAQAVSIQWSSGFDRMAEFVPAFLQRGLGQQALLLATFKGTIAFGYFHPVVMVLTAIVAAYFATEPAHDVESGRVDLTLARAIPRHRLITRSLILSLGSVVVFSIVMATGTTAGLYAWAPATWDWPDPMMMARLVAHLAAVAWCCGAFALAVAAGSKRWTTAFSLSALTIVVMYMLDFVAIAWPRARTVAWLSPFDYYPAIPILGGTAPAWSNLLVLWVTTIVFIAIAYWRFERRDL